MESLIIMGVELALFGMGTVFSFLVVLAFAMVLMSKLVAYFEKSSRDDNFSQRKPASIPSTELVAVVTAAIAKHRQVSK